MTETDILWNQYKQNVDLFKFYLEQLIKLETFYYAITGAIFSYYFANSSVEGVEYSLLLPFIMSIAFGGFFIYGACLMKVMRQETFEIRNKLGLTVAPDLGVLSVILIIFAIISALIAIACGYIIWLK